MRGGRGLLERWRPRCHQGEPALRLRGARPDGVARGPADAPAILRPPHAPVDVADRTNRARPHRDGFVRYAADPASLRHRYANHPFRRYAYATRERSGVVDGLLVFRETRLRGLPAVSLLAVHGADPETLLGSFAASLRPRRPLVHVLLSPASPLRGALASMGPALPLPFSRSPYHLITRALSSDTPAALFDLDRWACTGGDIL